MEYILIILILVIVICMGYILCKPFFDPSSTPEARDAEPDLEDRYQMVLQEIKAVKQENKSVAVPEEDDAHQLEQSKMMAADLLPSQPSQTVSEGEKDRYSSIPEEDPEQPKQQPPHGLTYCPQCGDEVMTSDKFCMHCGHPLQP